MFIKRRFGCLRSDLTRLKNKLSTRAMLLGIVMIVVGACNPAPTPVPPTVPPEIIIPTVELQIITLPPPTATSTPAPTSTPTVAPEILGLLGDWPIQIDYWFTGSSVIDQLHYVGTGTLKIVSGEHFYSATGSMTWAVIPREGSCSVAVDNTPAFSANLTGVIPLTVDQPTIDLTIDPQPLAVPKELVSSCLDFNFNQDVVLPSLALALDSAGQLQLTLPLKTGIVLKTMRDLSTASGGAVYGTLLTQIALKH